MERNINVDSTVYDEETSKDNAIHDFETCYFPDRDYTEIHDVTPTIHTDDSWKIKCESDDTTVQEYEPRRKHSTNKFSMKVPSYNKQQIKMKEKIRLAQIIRKEEIIYDKTHTMHTNKLALANAWERVARKMCKSVPDCKIMYRSLKDALRYRQKKLTEKSGDSDEDEDDSEFRELLAFLGPPFSKLPTNRRPVDMVSAETSTEAHYLEESDIDQSRSSISSFATKKDTNIEESSLVEMTKVFSSYMNERKQNSDERPTLKFHYIWQNLDHLFKQMSQEDVNELNMKFVTQACEKLRDKCRSGS